MVEARGDDCCGARVAAPGAGTGVFTDKGSDSTLTVPGPGQYRSSNIRIAHQSPQRKGTATRPSAVAFAASVEINQLTMLRDCPEFLFHEVSDHYMDH